LGHVIKPPGLISYGGNEVVITRIIRKHWIASDSTHQRLHLATLTRSPKRLVTGTISVLIG
ncbi:hypothetical protein KAI30_03295, partial [Candidatus Bathyarchaeota archaeon]|nr:hypothetical protein [Candidatus Bathyarchaeota archaeon]